MADNPFADAVPTHLAIAATVYTQPLKQLEEETKANRSKLLFVVGSYGNGKSHALQRLKNDINIKESGKLSIYTSAYATRSLRGVYEQMCSELTGGKLQKLNNSPESKQLMEAKGIPDKIINLFFKGGSIKPVNALKADLQFGKTISSSPDVINFACGISCMVDQLVLLVDDLEEAITMEKSERKAFLGHLRALYDEAVRKELNLILVIALTPKKLDSVGADRPDLQGRVDRIVLFNKPIVKEMSEIINKRLEITGLDHIKVDEKTLKEIWGRENSIRGILNMLRDLFNKAMDEGKEIIKETTLPEKKKILEELPEDSKPADSVIINILKEEEGLGADEIAKRSKRSGSWIKHRLAEMVTNKSLKKEQAARNKQAKYYLGEDFKK